jgi:protein-L-isoaspartate(D-aspartate) O-methyltransferase
MDRDQLNERLEQETQVFRNPRVKEAFLVIDRKDFVGADYEVEAYEDYALPLPSGQSISQPTTVAFMLELLDPKEGDDVLDIGSGSGWTSALLSKMVGPKGHVTALELLPELFEFGKKNVDKYHLSNVSMEKAEAGKIGKLGKEFDRVLVSASSEELPDNILKQVKEGGVLVMPVKNSIWRIEKKQGGGLESKEYPGFAFVPLVTE